MDLVNENYLRVKDKFLKVIDYVEDTGVRISTTSQGQNTRKKCGSSKPSQTQMSWREKHFLRKQMIELAEWNPNNNSTRRAKRLVNIFASIEAAIGSLVNAGQFPQEAND